MFLAHLDTIADLQLVWIPGQGVQVDYAAIVEILILQLDGQRASMPPLLPFLLSDNWMQMTRSSNRLLYGG